jgi:hypothetical protein
MLYQQQHHCSEFVLCFLLALLYQQSMSPSDNANMRLSFYFLWFFIHIMHLQHVANETDFYHTCRAGP